MELKCDRIARLVGETRHQTRGEVPLEFLIVYAREAIADRQQQEPDLQGRIDVFIDPRDRTVTVADNGTGMDSQDIEQLVRTMCYCGLVEVTTRKQGNPTGCRWTMQEDHCTFVLRKTDSPIGTTIKLFLRPEAPWPETDLVSQTLQSCSRMSPFPIFFNGEHVRSPEATGASDEFAYNAVPPNRSFTAPVGYHVRGRGKPLAYNTAND